MAVCLDHIIILLPYASLIHPPSWITDNFTLTPGGRHADGKTENALVCFRDGSYIEFIAFINDDPKHRIGHWWGDKKFGIVDFAFTHTTGSAVARFSELESRLQAAELGANSVRIEYQYPVAGGRKRPDGQDIKWSVTFPAVDAGYKRGELPFFCHDITPRPLRVPVAEESLRHPSHAYGITQIVIYVEKSHLLPLAQGYSAILDATRTSSEEPSTNISEFALSRLHEVGESNKVICILKSPSEEWQIEEIKEGGGVMLGDLIIGVHGASDTSGHSMTRIDTEQDKDGDVGMGRIFLGLGPPKT